MGSNTDHKSGRVEMVGPAGRVVVDIKDQATFEGKGYIEIEPTNLPLTQTRVPRSADEKADVQSGPEDNSGDETADLSGDVDIMEVVQNVKSHKQLQTFVSKNNINLTLDKEAKLSDKKDIVCEYIVNNSEQFEVDADGQE